MSNEEILRKAIEKAQENGYKSLIAVEQVIAHNNQFQNPIAIIFTHDFAKAFWGEKNRCIIEGKRIFYCEHKNIKGTILYPAWNYHLQKMVIKEEPLKYLEKFL